jgi:hypothetical protein
MRLSQYRTLGRQITKPGGNQNICFPGKDFYFPLIKTYGSSTGIGMGDAALDLPVGIRYLSLLQRYRKLSTAVMGLNAKCNWRSESSQGGIKTKCSLRAQEDVVTLGFRTWDCGSKLLSGLA